MKDTFRNKDYVKYKKINLSDGEKAELASLKKLSKNSLSDRRLYEAYEDSIFKSFKLNPYGATFFILSQKQLRIINSAVSKLKLSKTSKDKIKSLTRKFYVDFQNEFHDRRTIKEIITEENALKDLKTNFEIELDKLFSRFKKKYQNEDLSLQIAKFQLQLMVSFREEFFPPDLLPGLQIDPEYYNKIYQKLIPANRPTYNSYDRFLYSLSEIIKSDNNAYIPIIVEYLNSFTAKEITIFKNFEINNESIRMKISKYRRSINKGDRC